MAYKEAGNCNTEKSEWDEVGEEVTCSICKEIFTEPKTISCLHTFCEACIKLTIESNKRLGSKNCCPMCRTEFPDDVTKIPVNFSIKRLIEIFSKRKKSMQQARNEIKCGECTMNAPAIAWCVDCENFQCQNCHQFHEKLKVLRSHRTITVERFMQSPKKVLPTTQRSEYCKEHDGQPLDLYCTTCRSLICRDCTIVDHRQHQYNFVNILADQERAKIKMVAVPLETMLEQVSVAISKVESADNDLNNETDAERQVQEMYRQLHQMLDQCKVKDLQKVKVAKTSLLDSLSSQKGNLKLLQACLISCSEFVSKVTSKERASQLVIHSNDIQRRVNDLTNQVKQSSLIPVCGVDHMILSTSNPNDYVSHFTSLCRVSTLPVKDMGTKNIRDYTNLKQELLTISKYGSTNERLYLSYFLAVGPSDELICRGYNPGIVARLVVFSERLQYSHVIGDVTCRCPTGIAVSKEGCVYVAEFKLCKIFKFKMTGELVGEIGRQGSGNCQFKRPRGLLSSSSGLLFVCDSENNRIQVLKDDKFAYTFGKGGADNGNFNCPVAAALTKIEDQLFVSDCNNHRIQVFTIDGQFLRIFGNFTNISYTLKRPYGICCPPDGHVLIVSRDSNCVLIFDKDGQFVSAIEGTYQGRRRFSDPIGVVMRNNGQIVVAAHGSQNLTVF